MTRREGKLIEAVEHLTDAVERFNAGQPADKPLREARKLLGEAREPMPPGRPKKSIFAQSELS
jgi:hypothetical protein